MLNESQHYTITFSFRTDALRAWVSPFRFAIRRYTRSIQEGKKTTLAEDVLVFP